MSLPWIVLNVIAAVMQFSVGLFSLTRWQRCMHPYWAFACLWSIVPMSFWIWSGDVKVQPYYTILLFVRGFVRVVVTVEAIATLFFSCREDAIGYRRRLSLFSALFLASLTLLGGVTWQGYVRVLCVGALASAVILSTIAERPPAWPVLRHASIMFVWLSSAAIASAAGSRVGDEWDITATVMQIACYALWLNALRSACRPVSIRA